jgi:3-phenylpropionate/trans-cinnamate dioxygenase ferredoxin subunit
MSEWVKVANAGDVAEDEANSFTVGTRVIAIANLGGDLYAIDDLCSHQQCSLSEGDIDDTMIECPCHGSRFDITTGEAVVGPATEPLDVFKVREEGGELQVMIELAE